MPLGQIQVPFPDSTFPGTPRHGQESGGRIINGYIEPLGQAAPGPSIIRRAPGLRNFGTTVQSGFRGSMVASNTLYCAFNGRMVTLTSTGGVATDMGVLNGSSKGFFARNSRGPVSPSPGAWVTSHAYLVGDFVINAGLQYQCLVGHTSGTFATDLAAGDWRLFPNGPDFVFCDPDGNYALWNPGSNTIAQNYDPDLPAPNSVCSVDGYFFFTTLDGHIWASDFQDFNVGATSFATAEAKPDGLIRGVPWAGALWLFGPSTTEVWANAGTTPFPFQRAVVIPRGIAGPYCVTGFEDNFSRTLVWVGDDNTVVQANGYNPQKISPPDLDGLIEDVIDKTQLEFSCFMSRGHGFVMLSSPTWSWVFDLNTNKWAERNSYLQLRSRITGGLFAFNKWLCGDALTGNVHEITDQVATEPPRTQAITNAVSNNASPGNDSFTKILLHFNGPDASTNFLDTNAGGAAHTWTAIGNAQIDTAQSKFGGASYLGDGTGDWISTPAHANFNLGSSDFTFDCWFNCTAGTGQNQQLAGQALGAAATDSFFIFRNATAGELAVALSNGSTFVFINTTSLFTNALNPGWHHFAFVRTGNTLMLFIDGVQNGTSVSFTGPVPNSATTFQVGNSNSSASNGWIGWIDEFRLSVGVARWTTNFTPPISEYGGGAIRLTVADTSQLGSQVIVKDVTGTFEANFFIWTTSVIDKTHVDLVGSGFVNPYISGGTINDAFEVPFRWRLESGAVENFPVGARVGRADFEFVTGVGMAIANQQQKISLVGPNFFGGTQIWVIIENTARIANGDAVTISGVGGTTEANGTWQVTPVNATAIQLEGSTFAHAYTSGGIATLPKPLSPIETDPIVEISWSDDGGQTYYAPIRRKLGRQSLTRELVSLISCTGRSSWNARRWRLDISDPVYVGFMAAYQQLSPKVSDIG